MTKEQVFADIDAAVKKIPSPFSEYSCGGVEESIKAAKVNYPISIFNGISKLVIVAAGLDYVLKIPFTHIYDEGYEECCREDIDNERDSMYEEAAEILKQQNKSIILTDKIVEELLHRELPVFDEEADFHAELNGATSVRLLFPDNELDYDCDWNYCNLETAIYQEAVKRGLGAYFAEEGVIGLLDDGHPVYYQQRCKILCDMDEYNTSSEEYARRSVTSRAACERMQALCFNEWWIADFIRIYGEEEFKRLSDFLDELEIGDLRSTNIGYYGEMPVLVDYSGFRHWE